MDPVFGVTSEGIPDETACVKTFATALEFRDLILRHRADFASRYEGDLSFGRAHILTISPPPNLRSDTTS